MQPLMLLRSALETGRQSRGSGSYSFGVHHYGQWHGAPSRPERYCGPTDLERIRFCALQDGDAQEVRPGAGSCMPARLGSQSQIKVRIWR